MSKQESPITKLPPIEEKPVKKTKKNKRVTVCTDKRRMFDYCGICGSENVVTQGVTWCNKCGEEREYLGESRHFWLIGANVDLECACLRSYAVFRGVDKCLDCGAVEGPRCPACDRKAWGKEMKKYCRNCGYRS